MNYTAVVIAVCIAVACVAAASLAALIILYSLKKSVRSIELDDITGLPTFAKFKHDVRQILRNAQPDEFMFLMLNVDNFNFINDSYGFSRGNLLLLEIANHFSSQLQDGEILCRYYADTFILFTRNPQLLPLIEERVYLMTTMPQIIQDLLPTRYNLTFSTSVYYINDPSGDLTNMVDKANIARKIGKENVLTHRVMEYTKAMDEENELKKEITLSMDKAIENKEFEVYFQPKVYFENGKIMGAEALIRWNKPDRGLMTPDSFVPLFEHNGFIQKIDISVLEEVCHFLGEHLVHRQHHVGHIHQTVVVDVAEDESRYDDVEADVRKRHGDTAHGAESEVGDFAGAAVSLDGVGGGKRQRDDFTASACQQ